MSKLFLFAGTYTHGSSDGIYTYEINTANGHLSYSGTASELKNPSYQQVFQKNELLFSTGEIISSNKESAGVVASYKINKQTGGLEYINSVKVGGKAPCHISINSDCSYLFSANYEQATIHAVPVAADGKLMQPSCVIKRYGHSIDKKRQEAAHAHYVSLTPDEKYLCAVDLGTDEIALYRFDKENGKLLYDEELTVKVSPGSGPRHMVFHPSNSCAYLVNELSSNVIVYSYSSEGFVRLQTISTLPNDFTKETFCAAIRISPDGMRLFASNRGHDSIACYNIDSSGNLLLNGFFDVMGKHPRDFSIDPKGRYLYCANMHTSNITVFDVQNSDTIPINISCSINIPEPTCISFFETIDNIHKLG